MGNVYRARDSRLNRIVAIKQTREPRGKRFTQEALAIAALNHPNICQIYDVGPDYLVMEFVDGVPLRGPLPAEIALKIARAPDRAFGFTVAHVLRGELETAAEWASRMLDERLPWTGQLQYPFAAPLRESPWWPALRDKLNLRRAPSDTLR